MIQILPNQFRKLESSNSFSKTSIALTPGQRNAWEREEGERKGRRQGVGKQRGVKVPDDHRSESPCLALSLWGLFFHIQAAPCHSGTLRFPVCMKRR